jgi:hypothetical protein
VKPRAREKRTASIEKVLNELRKMSQRRNDPATARVAQGMHIAIQWATSFMDMEYPPETAVDLGRWCRNEVIEQFVTAVLKRRK